MNAEPGEHGIYPHYTSENYSPSLSGGTIDQPLSEAGKQWVRDESRRILIARGSSPEEADKLLDAVEKQ